MILDVTCDDIALRSFLSIVKNFLTLVQIFGPIVCMISLILIFIHLTTNPEDKKAMSKIKNTIIALVVLFMIPVLVDATMMLLDDSFKVSACWQDNVEDEGDAEYIEDDGKNKSSLITDPGEYNPGNGESDEDEE